MNPPFSSDDFTRLVNTLSGMQQFRNSQLRFNFIDGILQASPRASVLMNNISLSSMSANNDAVGLVRYLVTFGQDIPGREVVTLLIRGMLENMGENENAVFLRSLFEKYPLETSANFSRRITILFMTANPSNEAKLRTGAEQRDIGSALRQTDYRDRFKLESQPALRATDLQGALLSHQPQIVHFAGHGSGTEGLVFENDIGEARFAPPEAVAGLFGLLKTPVEVVVLNACYSKSQAELILPHVKVVIGMSDAIGDRSAIQFAIGFYRGLGYGLSIQKAFDLGINQMGLMGSQQTAVPVLHVNPAADANQIKLVS